MSRSSCTYGDAAGARARGGRDRLRSERREFLHHVPWMVIDPLRLQESGNYVVEFGVES